MIPPSDEEIAFFQPGGPFAQAAQLVVAYAAEINRLRKQLARASERVDVLEDARTRHVETVDRLTAEVSERDQRIQTLLEEIDARNGKHE